MSFRSSKKKRQPITEDMISSEYDELDAALDTRAAEAAAQNSPAAPEPAAADAPVEAPIEAQQTVTLSEEIPPQTPAEPEPAPKEAMSEPIAAEEPAPEEAITEPAAPEASPAAEEAKTTETSPQSQTAPEEDAQADAPAESEDLSEKSKKRKKKDKSKKPGKKAEKESEKESEEEDAVSSDPKNKKKKKRKKPKRKGRFITPLIILGILIGLAAACAWNLWYCQNNFEINFYQVETTHVTSDVRIVVISDVHLSEYGEDNKDLIEAVKRLSPDLIISAGDLVTYGEKNYDNMLSLCRQLVEIAPTYGVMGNHEDEKTYLEHDEELRQRFKDTGMILLVNKCEKLRIRNNDIELVGVSGGTEGFDLYGGKDTMDKLGERHSALRICIAHVPTLFKDRLEDYDFDIGIAGHTHGGVVRLPMIGGLYSAEEGFRPQFDGGLYTLDNGATLFVSRGLGNSGKIPRFNNTPELAVLDVRWY